MKGIRRRNKKTKPLITRFRVL